MLRQADHWTQVRMLSPQTGFLSGNEPAVHFGLGESVPEKLTVQWPSGAIQVIDELQPNTSLTIVESESSKPISPAVAVRSAASASDSPKVDSSTWFREVALAKPASHKELVYDDFASQPLLPNKLSQLGPGIAVADIDGDGDEDYFQGGARGTSGKLVINDGKGGFKAESANALTDDAFCEDMGAVWFDIDSDGDQDLYVVSGGVEAGSDAKLYQDRLYLNNGVGELTKAVDRLPEQSDSGGSVAAADFDRDGDLDLFVGGRVVPGKYPVSPASRLLVNNDGKLVDATSDKAEGLLTAGLVTGCVWSDANNDGWIDLFVSVEWGPVRFFKNQQGKLVEKTEQSGLGSHTGWWNGITARDFDNDGDIDLVATNFGLNTKYHASAKKPVMLYYGDFSGDGKYRLVEAEFEDEKVFPVRGKSCSTHAMPHLANKFKTYHDFALASLEDIYTPECLKESTRMMANTLESGVFLNSGDGKFQFAALPRLAQVSPAFGVVASDVNLDGNCDIYLVQNFFTAQPETGRMDGGLSQLLTGKGDGTFQVVMPSESGLVVEGDAMGLAALNVSADQFGFAVGVNDEDSLVFKPSVEHLVTSENQPLVIRLVGSAGNPTAVGAKVEVVSESQGKQAAEVTAGSGYLSQSSPGLVFGRKKDDLVTINVRWPNGSTSTHEINASESSQTIAMPSNN
ncbi:MAG: FG-GAP-like repeat-containing protein [Planctomycetota bacterium]